MRMVTIGPVEDLASFRTQVREAAARLGAPVRLGLLYLPIHFQHRAWMEEMGRVTTAPVVGATTGGAAFTERGFTRSGAVAALLGEEDLEVSVSVATGVKAGGARVLGEAIRGLRLNPERRQAVMVLADGLAVDGEGLLTALREHAPLTARHFGGTAGDGWAFKGTTFVFARGQVFSDAAVFVGLSSKEALSLAALHGWCVAQDGRELRVTEASGTVLKRLDGRPAVEVYREELRRLKLLKEGQELLPMLARYALGVQTPFGEQLKIRTPLGVLPDGSLSLAGSIAPGAQVRVVVTTPERLIEAANALSGKVLAAFPRRTPSAVLVFDCAARLQLLGERYGEQVRAFGALGRHPMLGLACYGEVAKVLGSVEGFHNTTAVMAAW
jgi:hypothetical protein